MTMILNKRTAIVSILGLGFSLALTWVLSDQNVVVRADPGVRYVASGGVCGGVTPCYSTVQAAVDAAVQGDEIRVAADTYTGVSTRSGTTQVLHVSKGVTIRGGYTTASWNTSDPTTNLTTLDARGQGRVLYITGNISPTIEGLRITGGDATGLRGYSANDDAGGGVYIITATAVISGNLVYSNTAGSGNSFGGGLFLDNSSSTLKGNTIRHNSAAHGDGMALRYSPAIVTGNTISDNGTNGGWGGGLYLRHSDATLIGNTVSGNTGGYGGGLALDRGHVVLKDNLIVDNTGVGRGGGLFLYLSESTLSGDIVSGNTCDNEGGGGLWIYERAPAMVNTVVTDNVLSQPTAKGSAIYVDSSSPHLLHCTIARNSGGDGSALYVTGHTWSGTYYSSTVVMTNTIIAQHAVGITVTEGDTVSLQSTLWHASPVGWGGAGVVNHASDYYGSPALQADGTHLTSISAAIDRGVDGGVTMDIDNETRPLGAGFDLGADEFAGTPVQARRTYLPLAPRDRWRDRSGREGQAGSRSIGDAEEGSTYISGLRF
jgi:parallel beta-helix repeat protein